VRKNPTEIAVSRVFHERFEGPFIISQIVGSAPGYSAILDEVPEGPEDSPTGPVSFGRLLRLPPAIELDPADQRQGVSDPPLSEASRKTFSRVVVGTLLGWVPADGRARLGQVRVNHYRRNMFTCAEYG
jgi:hypothetical protein